MLYVTEDLAGILEMYDVGKEILERADAHE